MMDVAVFEAANHLHDGVYLPDMAKELVAQAFSLACARNQSGDIDELDRCRDCPYRFGHLRERLKPGIGHRDDALVRVNRAKRVIRRLGFASPCYRVEKR